MGGDASPFEDNQFSSVVLSVGVVPDSQRDLMDISALSRIPRHRGIHWVPQRTGSCRYPNARDTVNPFIRASFAFFVPARHLRGNCRSPYPDGGVRGEIGVFPTLVRLTEGCRADRRSPLHGK